MSLSFDTLQYAKKLQQAGFTEKQAEIQAETFKEQAELINNWADGNLATKRNIKELEHCIKEVEERLTNRINEMSYKITIKLGSMIVGAVVILGILMPTMSKFLGGH
jgi:uncharacterized membrane protein YqiK